MTSKTVFQGKVFDVAITTMTINGQECQRDLVIHHGGAAICLVDQGKILLVEQTRAGAGEKTLEIPAGMIEPGEDPAQSAMRELNEETGYTAKRLELISAFWPTPGYDTEVIYVFNAVCPQRVKKRLPLDDQEDIAVCWMPLEEAYRQIEQGRIRDGKTILAIYWKLLQERK